MGGNVSVRDAVGRSPRCHSLKLVPIPPPPPPRALNYFTPCSPALPLATPLTHRKQLAGPAEAWGLLVPAGWRRGGGGYLAALGVQAQHKSDATVQQIFVWLGLKTEVLGCRFP